MGSVCWDRPPVNTGRASESLQSPVLPFKTRLCISFLVTPHYFDHFALVFLCCSCFCCCWGWCCSSNRLSHLKTRLYFHYLLLLSSWVDVRMLLFLICLLWLWSESQLWRLLSFIAGGDICISASHKIGILLLYLWPPFLVPSQYCALIFCLLQSPLAPPSSIQIQASHFIQPRGVLVIFISCASLSM